MDYGQPDYTAQYDYDYGTGQAQLANASERAPLYGFDGNGYDGNGYDGNGYDDYNYDYEQNSDYLQGAWNDLLQ